MTAAASLEGDGISVEVIDLRTLYPWDVDSVLASVQKTGHLVVVHEDHMTGGFGAEILATVSEQGAYLLEAPPERVCHMDVFWGPSQLEKYSTITADRIAAGIRRSLVV
jgi:pyruvate/2-oxoglutarate/acetoin dehydrogenase E1 component